MKNMTKYILFLSLLLVSFAGCNSEKNITYVTIHGDTLVSKNYIGNGVQWDPYQLDYGEVKLKISPSDWEKLYARLDFMRPHFIRVMLNTTSLVENGILNPDKNFENIKPILDYCQSRNVNVMFGDWGWGLIDESDINERNIKYAVDYLNYLVNEKSFSCINYYNLINEPNGYWAATNGSYPLWKKALLFFHDEMKNQNLTEKVKIVGPDIAIWDTKETWWIDSCSTHLSKEIGLYDIHTYPSKITVNSGKYSDIIRAYQKQVPEDKQIVMGEIGLKFVEEADSVYKKENINRAQSKKYASKDDSQLFVYDYMYGIDMADALIQTINAGYSGAIAWMLDDAMHANESPEKLKIWGFWNILGEEFFGKEEEKVRPWYYAWSLLCRYMPTGSDVYKVSVTGNPAIKAAFSGKDNNYMLALLNISNEVQQVKIQHSSLAGLDHAKKFVYSQENLKTEDDHVLLPDENNLTLRWDKGEIITVPANSLVVYTTFEY